MARPTKTERLSFQDRIVLLAVLAGLPGSLCALVLLWSDVRGGRGLR
jgi:hypothetical protein